MNVKNQQWADDESRIGIIKEQIACASQDQIQACLKSLQAHEDFLRGQRKGKKKRYVRFPKILEALQSMLKSTDIAFKDEKILDAFTFIASEYGGASTTIPKQINTLGFDSSGIDAE